MVNDYLVKTNFLNQVHPSTTSYSYSSAQSAESTESTANDVTQPSPSKGYAFGLLSPVAAILRTSASLLQSYRDGTTEEDRIQLRLLQERRQILHIRLKNATCMKDYVDAATQLDRIGDNQTWKSEKESDDYDWELVQAKLRDLDDARISCDVSRMLYLVRTALSRDLGGIGNVKLYKHSYVGTKDLIERYIDSTLETIRTLVAMSGKKQLPKSLETRDVLEQVLYARQAFGRSALLLSGGATFGMNHIGVLKALHEARLLPRIISGASAGSIVCSVLCTRTDEEIPDMLAKFPYGDLAVFEEEGREDGLLGHVGRLLTKGAWIDIKHLSRVMQEMLGDMTFQEAYNRTRRILNICVSSASIYELPRLLNYITSPNVMIWSAVAASCSVPVLFSAAPLLVKNPLNGQHEEWNPSPQKWVDGSVDNDLPMVKLAEMFNVNHFLVSQVNPHVVPFLEKDEALVNISAQSSSTTAASSADWAFKLTNLAKGEAIHRLHVMSDMGIFPNLVTKLRSVLSQKYSGDITILPEINYKDFPRMLKNPTSEFMLDACLRGERATWPKLSRIRNHLAVELELDTAVQSLRTNVVFSASQVDLRRLGTMDSTALGARIRRVSGSNVKTLNTKDKEVDYTDEEEPEEGYFGYSSGVRPPIRSHSSFWSARDRSQPPPMATRSSMSTSTTLPISTSLSLASSPIRPSEMREVPTTPTASSRRRLLPPGNLNLPIIALQAQDLSETETDFTPPQGNAFGSDADADVDSHTDDSTPEHSVVDPIRIQSSRSLAASPLTKRTNPRHLFYKDQIPAFLEPSPAAIFTSSQPTTPGAGLYSASLSLNATTPPSYLIGVTSSDSLAGGMRTPVAGNRTPHGGNRTPGTGGVGGSTMTTREYRSGSGSRTPLQGPMLSPAFIMTRGRVRGSSSVGGNCGSAGKALESSPERIYKRLFHGRKDEC